MAIRLDEKTLSDLPIPPGESLAEEIEALGMSQTQLAAALGRPVQAVNEIIRGKKAVTEETALGLERVLGIGAHVWSGLESAYRMTLARNRERERMEASIDWLKEFPIGAMTKKGWVAPVRDKREQVRELLSFFGVADVAAYRSMAPARAGRFRLSDKAKASEGALAAWLRKGETEAQRAETRDFDAGLLAAAAAEARSLTAVEPAVFAPRLERLFADAGVVFVVVPELPKTGANGVARMIGPRKALIQLNLRYKWADIFWFTLFHEVAHLLKHRRERVIVDGESVSGDPTIEAEANQWSSDFLIPPDAWRAFTSDGDFEEGSVAAFASEVGIAPGIVAGRLNKESLAPYSALASLKQRFAWSEAESA